MASPEPTEQQPHHVTPEPDDSTSSAAPPEPVSEPAAARSESVKEGDEEDDDEDEVEKDVEEVEDEDDEEEDESRFSAYMKDGGCKDAYTAWMDCVEAAMSDTRGFDDLVARCGQASVNLKNCMDAHADHYASLLEMQKALSESDDADEAAAAIAAAINEKAEEDRASRELPEGDEERTASDTPATAGERK